MFAFAGIDISPTSHGFAPALINDYKNS